MKKLLSITLLFISLSLFAQDGDTQGSSHLTATKLKNEIPLYRLRIIECPDYESFKSVFKKKDKEALEKLMFNAEILVDIETALNKNFSDNNEYNAGTSTRNDKTFNIINLDNITLRIETAEPAIHYHYYIDLNFSRQSTFSNPESDESYTIKEYFIWTKRFINKEEPILLTRKEEIRTVNDVVPFFGHIPLIGKLFQSKGESRMRRDIILIIEKIEN